MVWETIMNFSRDFLKVLVSPEDALKTVKDKKLENQGLYLYIFICAFLGFMLGGVASAMTGVWIIFPIVLAVMVAVIALLKLIVWAIISHIVAVFVFKGKGELTNTIKLMGFSAAPFILGIFALMTLILAKTIFTSTMLFTIMYIWAIVIGSTAVSTEHGIGFGRSFLSVLGIPALIIIGLMMIVEGLL